MKIQFNQDKTKVLFIHEEGRDYKILHNFPALLRDRQNPHFYAPAKPQVIYNIFHRLKRVMPKSKQGKPIPMRIAQDVLDFMNQPFALKKLPEAFKFHTAPLEFQEIALRYLYTVGSGGVLLDPGMGKSKVVLDYIALMCFKKALIVCPKPLLFVWEDEILKHRPELSFYSVKTTDWKQEKAGILESQVCIINYNKAVTFREELKACGFQFIHLDEFLIKDPSTERTKELTALARHMPYRAGGSGTLINNSVGDVFAPVRYLEPALIGMSRTNFLNHFSVRNTPKDGGPSRIVAFKNVSEARSILESCCIVMTKEKWLNLPEKKFHDIYVPLSDEQRRVSQELTRNKLTFFQGQELEVDNALVLLSKLYQISNGFVYYTPAGKDDEFENETSELLGSDPKKVRKKVKRQTLLFEGSAKIAALRKLVCETLPKRRAIIWFNMQAEYLLIKEMLEKEGKSFLTIKGGEPRTGEKVRQFNRDPSIDYLVCQAKSVNYGITVLGTTLEQLEETDIEVLPDVSPEVYTQIFYSMNFSLEVYLQQQDRIHRIGQKHVCEYYRIFALSPVEKRIRDAISEKLTIRHSLLIDIAEKIQKEYEELV